ncbi:MAG: LysM peptidoglycan-binding domain-containing protein [Steroidobacteraceae bacterium]
MFSNQLLGPRQALRLASGLACACVLSACSLFQPRTQPSAAPAEPLAVASAEQAPPELTATEAATDEADNGSADTTTVIGDASGMLNPTAPRDYVVRKGDTLWGIASMFLRDPWLWPEIWYVNPQVRNPHLIYPGDALHLAYGKDGRPQIQLERGSAARLHPQLRSSEMVAPIAAIPYDAIAAFLSKPTVLSNEQVKDAPYVVALTDNHLVAGNSNDVYVKKLGAGAGERFLVIHVEEALKDPQSGDKLGYMGVYAGTVQVTRAGETAKANVVDSGQEIVQGDILIADTSPATLNLVPHVPSNNVAGQVMAVVNGLLVVGQHEIVALNRGAGDGLAPGHILSVDRGGDTVKDRCAHIAGTPTCRWGKKTRLPDEANGRLLVFKTFARVSYALVLDEQTPINVGDPFHKP